MRLLPSLRSITATLLFTASVAFAQTPTFTVVNTGLDASFGSTPRTITDPTIAGFTGVAFGANLFVAVGATTGEDVIRWATSPDGLTWTGRTQAIGGGMKSFTNSRVHFLNGKFIFFTEHSATAGFSAWCYTSTDGQTWTAAKVADGRHKLEEFDSSPTLTVAVGSDGDQYSSADLITWKPGSVVTSGGLFSYNDVTYGNGRFVSTINGFGGQTYSSADATTWTALAGLTTPGGGRVEFGNGIFLLRLDNNRRSTDGITFTTFTPIVPTGWLAPGGVPRFTGGRFLSTAIDLNTFRSAYMASADGQNWTPVGYYNEAPATAGQSRFYIHADVAIGAGKVVVAGVDRIATAAGNSYLPLMMVLDAPAAPVAQVPPAITTPPVATAAVVGRSATLSVTATGTANSYQWRFNNNPITNATAPTYTIASVSAANAGNYSVVVTNSAGTITSATIVLSLVPAAQAGRLINLSVLTDLATATDEFTLGYVVGGPGTTGAKPLVIRAAGPSLGALGVPGTISDPKLETFAGATSTGVNDNWGGSASLTADLAAVGAFAYTGPTSRDAAVSANITSRDNSVKVSGVGGATGTVIAEVYDATPAPNFAATTPRLLNVSVRKHLGTSLTAGFVLGGTTPTRVLIRVVGPGLAAFGVPGTVVDPQLALFNSSSTKIAENNDWGGSAELTAAFTSVGAFALPAATSKDAALLISLPPGGYSVQATGVGGTTGVGIVEVYEVP